MLPEPTEFVCVCTELRDMRKKAERDKQEAAFAEATMASIEAKARKEFEKDMKAAAKDAEERIGTWVRYDFFALISALVCILASPDCRITVWVQSKASHRRSSPPQGRVLLQCLRGAPWAP